MRRPPALAAVFSSTRMSSRLTPEEIVAELDKNIVGQEAAKRAVEHARSGQGPVLLEAVTYRFRGHSAQDTQKYRTKEDVEKYRTRDPNEVFRKRLVDEGILTEEQAQQLDQQAEQEAQASVDFADQSPEADEKWLTTGIYANPIEPKY